MLALFKPNASVIIFIYIISFSMRFCCFFIRFHVMFPCYLTKGFAFPSPPPGNITSFDPAETKREQKGLLLIKYINIPFTLDNFGFSRYGRKNTHKAAFNFMTFRYVEQKKLRSLDLSSFVMLVEQSDFYLCDKLMLFFTSTAIFLVRRLVFALFFIACV